MPNYEYVIKKLREDELKSLYGEKSIPQLKPTDSPMLAIGNLDGNKTGATVPKDVYSLDGEITLPVLKPDKAPINAVINKEEKPKPITPPNATPTIPDATAPEGDKKDEGTTDTPSNEINLNDILANLHKGYAQSDEVKQALAKCN